VDILIPCKGFAHGKSRLAGVLTPHQRATLCAALFRHTLAQALDTGARVAVVSEDAEVVGLARSQGAQAIADPGGGLNAALAHGAAVLRGGAPLILLPIDLPGLTAARLTALPVLAGVTLVPDWREDGTNLMLLDPVARDSFRLAYGAGSLTRHARNARALSLPLRLWRDPHLAHDLDTPADFDALRHPLSHLTKGHAHEAA
jgi:2-phospho-L-lactate/phosphoenolpyruvate guanylyltransferase